MLLPSLLHCDRFLRSLRTAVVVTLLLGCALLAPDLTAQPAGAETSVRSWRTANERAIIDTYLSLLRLPNVARDDGDVSANAALLRTLFEARGFTVTSSADRYPDQARAPVVFAHLTSPAAVGTLLLYIHYDGQPVNPGLWTHCPPFEPCLVGDDGVIPLTDDLTRFDPQWRLYARSASDDKAPIMALLAAMDALRATGQSPRWNLRVVLDGQEESGSTHLRRYLAAHPDAFAADLAITLDGPRHPSGLPTVYFGVRGGASLVLRVHTAQQDLHSGNYGNWAPDPSVALGRLLASMKDETGRVTIAGFQDQVTPLTLAEQAALSAIPNVEASLAATFGIAAPEQSDERLEAKLNQPTLNVLAMDSGGGLDAPSRTAIPAFAQARIAMRLVNGIDPQRQVSRVIEHVRRQGYHVVENRDPTPEERQQFPRLASINHGGGSRATRVPLEEPLAEGVIAALTLDGVAPVQLPTLGGSLPFGEFAEGLGIPTVGVALVNHDNNQHGPDENLRLLNLWQGIEILARLVTQVP